MAIASASCDLRRQRHLFVRDDVEIRDEQHLGGVIVSADRVEGAADIEHSVRILDRQNRKYGEEKSPAGKTDYHTMGACHDVLRVLRQGR